MQNQKENKQTIKKRYAQSEVEKPKRQREVRQKTRRPVKQNVIQEEAQEEQQMPAVGSFGAIVNIVKSLLEEEIEKNLILEI